MKITNGFFFLLFIGLLSLSACKKDKITPPPDPITPSSNKGTLTLSFRVMSDTMVVNSYDTLVHYTSQSGRKYSISLAKMYLSSIVLIREDSSEFQVAGKYVLVDALHSNFIIGDTIPAGKYIGLKFLAGVDKAGMEDNLNHTSYPSDHPLYVGNNMYWTWNTGYVFLKMEGKMDSSAVLSGLVNRMYEIHIGQASSRRSVTLYADFTVPSNGNTNFNLQADFNHLLKDLPNDTNWFTHFGPLTAQDAQIQANFGTMFSTWE